MKYLILSKIIIFPSTLFFVTYLYYLAIKKKKKSYFGSQKYILKSEIPLTVTDSVILSACHSGGPHRSSGEKNQRFSQ